MTKKFPENRVVWFDAVSHYYKNKEVDKGRDVFKTALEKLPKTERKLIEISSMWFYVPNFHAPITILHFFCHDRYSYDLENCCSGNEVWRYWEGSDSVGYNSPDLSETVGLVALICSPAHQERRIWHGQVKSLIFNFNILSSKWIHESTFVMQSHFLPFFFNLISFKTHHTLFVGKFSRMLSRFHLYRSGCCQS